jgi:hypothetical protein
MTPQDLNSQLSQLSGSTTTNCISPYVTGCWPYPQYTAPTPGTLNVEKLPGGFIVTLNGRREIVSTVDGLAEYLKRWSAEK